VTGALVLGGTFGLIAAAALLRIGWLRLQFARLGYRAIRSGRDNILYEERDLTGARRRVVFGGEMLSRGPHLLYAPDAFTWNDSMPAWLHDRCVEVFQRITERFGPISVEVLRADGPQNNKMQQTKLGQAMELRC